MKQGFSFETVKGNLFDSPKEYCLCHCVSRDLAMGAGIAKIFKDKYKGVQELKNQNIEVGGCGKLSRNGRVLYYLVTKEKYWHKPSYKSLTHSLDSMKLDMLLENKHTLLAMPLIGCGLDKLEWSDVEKIVRNVFFETNFQIKVYKL